MIGLGDSWLVWSVTGHRTPAAFAQARRGFRDSASPVQSPHRRPILAESASNRQLTGLGITFLSALFFSLITTFARLAYDSGSNPGTQVLLRSLCMMLVLAIIQSLARRSILPPRRVIPITLALGVCVFLMSFGYLSSVAYISVSLAVLLLYTFPLMVGVASPLLGREKMTWLKAICLIGAFSGLVVASWTDFGALDWRGIAFALSGAAGVSGISLFGGKAMARAHPFAMNAAMNLWVALAVAAILLVQDNLALPQTTVGWLATAGVCVCYTLGALLLFQGLTMISPAQSALTLNLEPFFSTVAAILLLHEAVGLQQWIGMAMLLMFLAVSVLPGLPRRGKA